jgi:hypothetical protein
VAAGGSSRHAGPACQRLRAATRTWAVHGPETEAGLREGGGGGASWAAAEVGWKGRRGSLFFTFFPNTFLNKQPFEFN